MPYGAASRFDLEHDGAQVEVEDEDDQQDAALLRQVRELAAAHPDDAARVLRQWIYQG